MFKPTRPLIVKMTPDQKKRESNFSKKVAEAELDTLKEISSGGIGPTTILEIIENASGFAEAASINNLHPQTPPIACKAGCNLCCFQSVGVSAPEAFRIANFINVLLGESEKDSIIECLRSLDKLTRGVSPSRRTLLQVPCAFLKEGICAIYPVRPLACAKFTSFDVHDCEKGKKKGFRLGTVTHEKARLLVYNAVQKGLNDGLRESLPNADLSLLELSAAVLSALSSPDAAQQWLNGEPIFSPAHAHSGGP